MQVIFENLCKKSLKKLWGIKKNSNFAPQKSKVALVLTIQLAEMEGFSPFLRGSLRVAIMRV